jgi:diguanylate cyclase (GGDEF)-like protein
MTPSLTSGAEQFQARHDSLTGLPDRSYLIELLDSALRDAGTSAVLFINLDRFQHINDTLGHAAGDQLLREVSERVKRALAESDFAGRMGGDEFAVIPIGVSGDNVEMIVERFRKKIEEQNRTAKRDYKLSLSIGTAYYDPLNPCSLDQLLTLADKSMYGTKKKETRQ